MLKAWNFRNAAGGLGYIIQVSLLFQALNFSQVRNCSEILELRGSRMYGYICGQLYLRQQQVKMRHKQQ